jgi:hypothetical protein
MKLAVALLLANVSAIRLSNIDPSTQADPTAEADPEADAVPLNLN